MEIKNFHYHEFEFTDPNIKIIFTKGRSMNSSLSTGYMEFTIPMRNLASLLYRHEIGKFFIIDEMYPKILQKEALKPKIYSID